MNDRDKQRLLDEINEENSRIGALVKMLVLVLGTLAAAAILFAAGTALIGEGEVSREAMGMLWWMLGILVILLLIWVSAR